MSGGKWDYNQYRFTEVIDDIKELISKNGQKKTEEELRLEYWNDKEWYEKHPEGLYHYKYPDEVIEKFKEGVDIIEKAQIFMQRFDWLLCHDDSEESFISRLEEELNELKIKNEKVST